VILAVAMSAVSLYYYLQVLKQSYVNDLGSSPGARNPLNPSVLTQVVLVVLAGLVILLGCAPNLLIGWILAAIGSGPA
jgi:NADH-quinone oxidoreductase subunit N